MNAEATGPRLLKAGVPRVANAHVRSRVYIVLNYCFAKLDFATLCSFSDAPTGPKITIFVAK